MEIGFLIRLDYRNNELVFYAKIDRSISTVSYYYWGWQLFVLLSNK